ncbi:MAG: drug/metabolite transporter (DMT)-like permease [Cellvibrionaceae bacterium]|jgi:drug/metabolite transporter (DMT)-like permease
MMLSAMGFAAMGALVKVCSAQGISVMTIIAARALVSLVLSVADVKRKRLSLLGNQRFWLFARGLVGTFALICVYFALTSLPFAEATVLQYLHPAFTAVLAIIFLGERIHPSTIVCIFLSVIGLAMIIRPEFLFGAISADFSPFAVTVAIAGALGSGIAYVLVRKLSATEDPSVIIFYFPLVALPVALLAIGGDFIMPRGWQWILLIAVGVATQIGQIGLTKAMQTETASKATSYSYLQVVFAAILGSLLFSETPSLWTWLGAALIIGGAAINMLWKEKN